MIFVRSKSLISSISSFVKSGFTSFDVQDKPHHVEVRTAGDGVVRLFGATLDRERNGVTFDALGINGERAINVLDKGDVILSGTACGVDGQGRLLVQTPQGAMPISVGEISIRRQP